MSTSITPNDRQILIEAVERSIECDCINEPYIWKGRHVDHRRRNRGIFGPEGCCIYLGGGGGRDDKAGLILALIATVAAFFVGLFCTADAINDARNAQHELRKLRGRIRGPQSNPYPRSSNPLFFDAETLLRGRREDRIFAAIGHGLWTAGAGLLTVAILVALATEPQFWTGGTAIAGGCAVSLGAILFFAKLITKDRSEEQAAADRIARALFPPQRNNQRAHPRVEVRIY